jgi:glycosyltransferase involved in cell wall biosynthesis
MKKFTFAKANAGKLVRLPLYALAGLVASVFPRDRELWVFGRKTGVGEGPLRLLRVVGTDVDGIRDIIRDGLNGYLVPANDAEAMASRVEELLTQREIREAMSVAASEEARNRFDIRKAMPQFESFYVELARGR